LYYQQQEASQGKDVSGTLLITFIIATVLLSLANVAIIRFYEYPQWAESPIKYLRGFLDILRDICFILPALAIRKKTLKMIGIILASIVIVFRVYSTIAYVFA